MTPQVNLNGRDTVVEAQAPSTTVPTTPPVTRHTESPAPHELTYAERQGLAMGWIGIAFGLFLLLAGLALWAASALSAGFGGWLISVAVMGVIMVAAIVAVAYFVIRPGR